MTQQILGWNEAKQIQRKKETVRVIIISLVFVASYLVGGLI